MAICVNSPVLWAVELLTNVREEIAASRCVVLIRHFAVVVRISSRHDRWRASCLAERALAFGRRSGFGHRHVRSDCS